MRRVIFYVAASLDGYLARRDHALDWLPVPTAAEDYGYAALLARIDTLLMGRKTYEVTRTFGPWPYPGHRTLVFSRSGYPVRPEEAETVERDPVAVIRELQGAPGRDVWLVGGGELAATCLDAGVVDEMIVTLVPVLLGDGIPLFTRRAGTLDRWRLAGHRAFADGLVQLTYDRA